MEEEIQTRGKKKPRCLSEVFFFSLSQHCEITFMMRDREVIGSSRVPVTGPIACCRDLIPERYRGRALDQIRRGCACRLTQGVGIMKS